MCLPLIAAFVTTGVWRTQAAPQGVHVETLQALATGLSTEAGRLVEADQGLAGLPVFVDRRSMTPTDVLNSVAYGLRASVVPTKTGWRITRTPLDGRAILADAHRLWKGRLEAWLAQCDRNATAAARYGNSSSQFAHYQGLLDDQLKNLSEHGGNAVLAVSIDPNELAPLGVLYRSVVTNIGIDTLSDTGPEERRIWSNRPDANQRSCPQGDSLLERFDQAQQRFLDRTSSKRTARPARFTFVEAGAINFRLSVYDSEGNDLGDYGGPPFDGNMAGPIAVSYSQLARQYGASESTWLRLGPATLRAERFAHHYTALQAVPKSELPECFTSPDHHDPLDYTVRLGLNEVARESPGNGCVVVPSDDLLRVAGGCVVGTKMNVSAFRGLLDSKCQFEHSLHAGVTIYRAQDPFAADRRTADRPSLAMQVRLLLQRPVIAMADVAACYAQIFPREDSPVAMCVLGAIERTQPHNQSNGLNMSGGPLAMLGAAIAAEGSSPGGVELNPLYEPFRTMINRGINDGWIRFKSAQRVPAALMDPAIEVASPRYAPRLIIGTAAVPALCALGLKPPGNVDPRVGHFEAVEAIGAMYGAMAASLPLQLYPGQADKMPDRDQLRKKIRSFGNYHLATHDQINLDFFAYAGMRARLSLDEIAVKSANEAYDDLPRNVRERMLDAAVQAVGDLVKRAGQPNSSGTESKVAPNKPPSA
ncbi:MAG: hypothetical protein ACYC96_15290 [Fimbriimonadaceae bacterium]